MVDPHCLLSPADIRTVDGRLDEAGLPLGRCLVSLQSGEELSGVWRAGSYSQARERTVISHLPAWQPHILVPWRHSERQELTLIGGPGCLELCLCGIRELA